MSDDQVSRGKHVLSNEDCIKNSFNCNIIEIFDRN